MRVRSFLICCSLLICLVNAAPAVQAATSLSVSVTSTDANLGDALLLGAAAMFFGLDTSISLQYRADTGSATGAVSLFYLAGETQAPPEVIVVERKKGRGWGALAKGKTPPGLVGKWKKDKPDLGSWSDRDFETGVNIRFLATYYAVPEDTIIIWVRRGISVPDVALCLNLAARARVAPSVIVDARLRGTSWPSLATRYKVSVDLIKQPVAPKAKYHKTIPVKGKATPPGQQNGKGKGKKGK